MEAGELGQPDRLRALAKELSQGLKLSVRDQTSLGVVLHLADDLDVGIVQEAFENPELFEQARALVRETPAEVVTDLSTDQDPAIQWRYYPLLSGQRSIVLRHRTEFFERDANAVRSRYQSGSPFRADGDAGHLSETLRGGDRGKTTLLGFFL